MVDLSALLKPSHLYRRTEVLARPALVPAVAGVYAWYFDQLPPELPVEGCNVSNGSTLLYLGIAPTRPAKGKPASRTNLRSRIRDHYDLNAEGSTLRLTLGCLLADTLGTELRRTGSGKRRTFADREDTLSQWMNDNAFVCWLTVKEPWKLEEKLLGEISLPLNLKGNKQHLFHARLSGIRRSAKKRALELPVNSGR